jgi:hypothetical protein
MSSEQNARHNHYIKTANKSLENVTYVENLETTLTDKITYTKTLKTEEIQEMPGSIWYRILCVPVCQLKGKRLRRGL